MLSCDIDTMSECEKKTKPKLHKQGQRKAGTRRRAGEFKKREQAREEWWGGGNECDTRALVCSSTARAASMWYVKVPWAFLLGTEGEGEMKGRRKGEDEEAPVRSNILGEALINMSFSNSNISKCTSNIVCLYNEYMYIYYVFKGYFSSS